MSSRQSLERSARSHPVRARVATVITMSVVLVGFVVGRAPQPLAARSAEPTFAEDVAPILYANCTTCHHPGGLGPFSLLDYEGAKAKTDEMHDAVEARYMPPWHAEGPHGVFRNDRRLAEADRQTILRWIESGAKPGDLSKAPPKPEYPAAWSMGTPDAVVTMPAEFTVPASGTVEYQYFEIPTNFIEEKWVQAIEIM